MRSTRVPKSQMKNNRHKVNRKKRAHTLKESCGYDYNISNADLENINEVLCTHKTYLAEARGAWKVVPKDSCEVYKGRRKRQFVRDSIDDDKLHQDNENRKDMRNKRNPRRRNNKKIKKEPARNRNPKCKPYRRQARESSVSSCTTCTSFSSSTIYTSASDIEYD